MRGGDLPEGLAAGAAVHQRRFKQLGLIRVAAIMMIMVCRTTSPLNKGNQAPLQATEGIYHWVRWQ